MYGKIEPPGSFNGDSRHISITLELVDAILNRRSCRSYDQSRHVPPEVVREIIRLGTWAPSGSNTQPWKVTVLSGKAKDGFISAFRADLESKRAGMTEAAANIAFWSCTSLEKSDVVLLVWDRERSETSPQSVGAFIQTAILAAHGMGLGTLWVAAVNRSESLIAERYGHADWKLIAGMGIGFPSEKMVGKSGPPRLPVEDVAEFLV